MSDQHTQEPWADDGFAHIGAVSDQMNDGYFVALCEGPDKVANARRIVACVNACAGIPTESLEQFSQDGSLKVLARNIELEKERDRLILAVADHATARCELAAQNVAMRGVLLELTELEEDIKEGIFDSFTLQPARVLLAEYDLASEVLKRRDAEIDLAADRLEVLEREHAEFFDRWHGERRMREKLVDDVERCYRMLLSEPNTKGALFKAENILREALADAKASTFVPVRLSDGLEG